MNKVKSTLSEKIVCFFMVYAYRVINVDKYTTLKKRGRINDTCIWWDRDKYFIGKSSEEMNSYY